MNLHDKTPTKDRILEAAKREFLEKGFRNASLRNITKQAGVTTGALYSYFQNKEALFDALVNEHYRAILNTFHDAQNTFAALPPQEQAGHMGDISGRCIQWMTDYMYEHYDAFKLLLCCSEGTRYDQLIHEMVEIEMEATHRFLHVLRSLGHSVREMDPQLEHLLVSGMLSAFFEIIIHDMPQEQAQNYVKELREFYTAGWQKIMGL